MRPSTRIVIFLVFFNLAASMVMASGLGAAWGVAPNPGGDDEIDAANAEAEQVEPSGGFGETLFMMYNSIADTFNAIVRVVFAGPTMLTNVGIPAWFTTFLFGPMYILVGLDIMYALTGREL